MKKNLWDQMLLLITIENMSGIDRSDQRFDVNIEMVQESCDSYVRDPASDACYIYLNNFRRADPLNITGFKEPTIK